MASNGEWVPVKRGDHERVLVTEALPFETPIIFSSDGFYTRVKDLSGANVVHRDLVDVIAFRRKLQLAAVTIPFSYKIRKGMTDFRRLAVLHPSALWDVKKFYETYDEWMIYQCSLSPLSIRAPQKISGSFFEKNETDAINQFKKGDISTVDVDSKSRYNPSYFSYRGVTRLYQFFTSEDFLRLEQKYGLLRTLDVSRCFDSIYTHSIAWALRGKGIAKDSKNASTSAKAFDDLMMSINHGETNGIVIGPEISRIFAEIIFQRIDLLTISKLEQFNLHLDRDFSIRRYVDDVFVFANSDAAAQYVYDSYADSMAEFNLYTNPHKSSSIARPFITQKSHVIHQASKLVESLTDKLFEKPATRFSQLRPSEIFRGGRLLTDFMASLKSMCFASDATYYDISSYLISACCERIKRMVKRKRMVSSEDQIKYRVVSEILVKLMFFLYSVGPTVNASYRLAVGITLLQRFARQRLPNERAAVDQLIYSEALKFLMTEGQNKSVALSAFVSLEALNVLVVLRELGDKYLVPPAQIEKIFRYERQLSQPSNWCYFDLVVCMYYIGDHIQYSHLRTSIDTEVDRRLSEVGGVAKDAEIAYLFLDMLTCPYVHVAKKTEWLNAFRIHFSLPNYSVPQINTFFASATNNPWFTNWQGVDILTLLQKKEIIQAY